MHDNQPNFDYAEAKLGTAVYKLATGADSIKARLADAYIELAILTEADFPPSLRNEFRLIRSSLTSGKMQFETHVIDGQLVDRPIGLLYSTLRFMRRKKACRIAELICDLEYKLRFYREVLEESNGTRR